MRAHLTFIFAYVLESKGQAGVLSLYDADLAKGALADDAEQSKVVEAHCCTSMSSSLGVSLEGLPSSVKTTGLPLELPILGGSRAAFDVEGKGKRSEATAWWAEDYRCCLDDTGFRS
jgi:hypothetical protein